MSAETEKLFKGLLKEMRPLFKEHGFRAVSQNFVFESNECWVIFNFQKSRWSDSEETTFYVNVAASSKTWLGFEGKPADKVPPLLRLRLAMASRAIRTRQNLKELDPS